MCIYLIKSKCGSRLRLQFHGAFSLFQTTNFNADICVHYVDLYLDSKFEYPDAKLVFLTVIR